MTNPTILKQSIEAEVSRMSQKGVKLIVVRGRIDMARSVYEGDAGMQKFLNTLEMQYVIKPLGGLPYGKAPGVRV